MHIHIIGICGTFMAGIALIARTLGYTVSGCDQNIYPPMSEQLAEQGINIHLGYAVQSLDPAPELYIIGNALTRGTPIIEHILNKNLPYLSAAQWLAQYVLHNKHVLAVSGTHGKTTTTSILTWLLSSAGYDPGFMIGGIANNFASSAHYTKAKYFVIEADEYDTAFFDKRAKFVHYHPRTLIINNIEFDHADIYPDLDAIKRQFHHLIRILPSTGHIIAKQNDSNIDAVLAQGCWTPVSRFGDAPAQYKIQAHTPDYRHFSVHIDGQDIGDINWDMIGRYNAENATAAIAAAAQIGIPIATSCAALSKFTGVKRRLEQIAKINGIIIYDDFAHHPTAIAETLCALRQAVGAAPITVIVDPASNTMCNGSHKATLSLALQKADNVILYQSAKVSFDLAAATESLGKKRQICTSIEQILTAVTQPNMRQQHIVIMSNASFGGLHKKLLQKMTLSKTNPMA